MPKRKKTKKLINPNVGAIDAPRNPYASHPLMKKGGVHQKSNKANRAKFRRETRQQSLDWEVTFFIF